MEKGEQMWSSGCPGLLVLLMDETEESSKAVNRIIDYTIEYNFDGKFPKNRCFILVVGYNHNVKNLASGYLKDLDANPLRVDSVKQKIFDGAGGLVATTVEMPIWVDSDAKDFEPCRNLHVLKDILAEWHKEKSTTSIVIDIFSKVKSGDIVESMKRTMLAENNDFAFFFGCDAVGLDLNEKYVYDTVPQEWIHRMYRMKDDFCMDGVMTVEDACH